MVTVGCTVEDDFGRQGEVTQYEFDVWARDWFCWVLWPGETEPEKVARLAVAVVA